MSSADSMHNQGLHCSLRSASHAKLHRQLALLHRARKEMTKTALAFYTLKGKATLMVTLLQDTPQVPRTFS